MSNKKILVIDGMSITGCDWYSTHIFDGVRASGEQAENLRQMWSDMGGIERVNYDYGKGKELVKERILCNKELKALIVCDLSDTDTSMLNFVTDLGELVLEFTKRGGWVLFPTSEGGCLVDRVLKNLFSVPWTSKGYYRSTWDVPPEQKERVLSLFGQDTPLAPYSAKCCTIRNAENHACYGASPDSRHESLSMVMSGNLDASRKESNSVTAPEGLEANFDVICCAADIGLGKVAYFGDVNAEYQTCFLIASMVRTATNSTLDISLDSITLSNKDPLALNSTDFGTILSLKEQGNQQFMQKKFRNASRYYLRAIKIYDDSYGSQGEQRNTKSILYSNLAECYLNLKQFSQALKAAVNALDVDQQNLKARLRLAKAITYEVVETVNTSQPIVNFDDVEGEIDSAKDELDAIEFDLENSSLSVSSVRKEIKNLRSLLKKSLQSARASHNQWMYSMMH